MKRPGVPTLLAGSRLTGPLVLIGSAYVTWRWWQNGTYGFSGLFAIALILFSLRAMRQMAAYRQWRADWQAMGPGGSAKSFRIKPQLIVSALAMIVALGLLLYLIRPDAGPTDHLLLGGWVIGGGAIGLAVIAIRLAKRLVGNLPRRSATAMVAVNRPAIAVPSLQGCHRRLPPYCQALITSSS